MESTPREDIGFIHLKAAALEASRSEGAKVEKESGFGKVDP